MNARDQLKPKTIRLAILLALADGAITTIDDLQIHMDEPRKKIVDNAVHAANDDLIKRMRDDVTRGPAYQITAAGREYLAKYSGEVAEPSLPGAPICAESKIAVITSGVTTDFPAFHEPTASAIVGAMAFGYQGSNEPPEGHWLTEFHQRGVADAQKDAEIARASRAADLLVIERDEQAVRIDEQQSEIDRLSGELAEAKASIELCRMARAVTPAGYVTQHPGKPLARFTKAENAQARAMSAARAGKRAQVFALVQVGTATPGAEWVKA